MAAGDGYGIPAVAGELVDGGGCHFTPSASCQNAALQWVQRMILLSGSAGTLMGGITVSTLALCAKYFGAIVPHTGHSPFLGLYGWGLTA